MSRPVCSVCVIWHHRRGCRWHSAPCMEWPVHSCDLAVYLVGMINKCNKRQQPTTTITHMHGRQLNKHRASLDRLQFIVRMGPAEGHTNWRSNWTGEWGDGWANMTGDDKRCSPSWTNCISSADIDYVITELHVAAGAVSVEEEYQMLQFQIWVQIYKWNKSNLFQIYNLYLTSVTLHTVAKTDYIHHIIWMWFSAAHSLRFHYTINEVVIYINIMTI